MEGFIFIGFLIFLSFIFSKSNSNAVKGKKKKSQNYEVPAALRNKWKTEDQLTYRGRQGSASINPEPNPSPWQGKPSQVTLKDVFGSKSNQKQLEDSQDRNAAQIKNLARTGDGRPKDKNFNRRVDWGHRGAGKTALAPFFTAALIAAAIAVFFMTQ